MKRLLILTAAAMLVASAVDAKPGYYRASPGYTSHGKGSTYIRATHYRW